jgi:RsiW-degrading membrane proteinase PrsW (M82 family)
MWRIVVAFAVAACSAPVGSDDVTLSFHAGDDTGRALDIARLRLLVARVPADFEASNGDVVIRLAAPSATTARRVLAAHGGLEVYRMRPGQVLEPRDTSELVRQGDHWVGPPRALDEAALDTADATDRLVAGRTRTFTVSRGRLFDVPRDAVAVGNEVVVELPDAAGKLATWGEVEVGLVIASQLVWRGRLRDCVRDGAIVVPQGDDLTSYYSARRTAAMIDAPGGMPLWATARADAPIDWLLVLGSTLVPLATGLAWLVFVRRFDRARAEPWWILGATFVLGMIAQRAAGFVELGAWRWSPYLEPRMLARDRGLASLPASFGMCVLVVGVVEEGAKLLATTFARRRREFDEPIDGIIYAAAAAIGFAAAENLTYFTDHRASDDIVVARTLLGMPGHVMYASIWGYALGQRLVRRGRLLVCFAIAAVLHAAWDSALDFAIPHAPVVLCAADAIAFAVVVRLALRWGPVDTPLHATGSRHVFRVGRAGATLLAVGAMFALGYALIEVSSAATANGERLAGDVALRGLALGVGFVVAALAAVWAMPLDVVVDDHGLTYAGALYRWADLGDVRRPQPWTIVVHTRTAAVQLGPGARETMDRLEAALKRQ